MLNLLREQPRAFYMIFMLEVWERFGFYTVQGILILFFIRFLGLSDTEAYYTFGAFSALVYGLIAIGGFLGDKVLGTKRTIIVGLITLAAGYLALTLANKEGVYWALGLICVGNGLFKANPSSLLAKCYQGKNDLRVHGGFTLYYMAINLGSTFALLLGPTLSNLYGYSYAYFSSFLGLLLALANYWLQRKHVATIQTSSDNKTIAYWQWLLVFVGILIATSISAFLLQHIRLAKSLVWCVVLIVIGLYILYMLREEQASRIRMGVALILMLEGVLFFVLYQQMPTSLNLFAVHNIRPSLLGFSLEPQSFQALNSIWIIIMSPVLAFIYKRLNQHGLNFSIPNKFAVGMFCSGLSFTLLYFARYFHDEQAMVSSVWLIASYFFQSTGELLVSALGVAMIAELVPAQITGFVMGMWFLTSSVAGFIGASVASLASLPKNLAPGLGSLTIYTQVFAYIGLTTLGVAILMWFTSAFLNRFIKA